MMKRSICCIVWACLLGVRSAALASDGLEPMGARGEVEAASPRRAVERLVERVLGADHAISIGVHAFEGLPKPAQGIWFEARDGQLDEARYRLRVTVVARTRRRLLARRSYVFPWTITEKVFVPRRVIRAGTTISIDDLHEVELHVPNPEGFSLSLDRLVGRSARRTLLANRPVPERLLVRPAAIQRGERVVVQALRGPMRVTMKGEALERGALGDIIRVLNPSSNQVLSGRVIDRGLVEVSR